VTTCSVIYQMEYMVVFFVINVVAAAAGTIIHLTHQM